MANNAFYNYSGSVIAGVNARAEVIAAEYSSVAAGFSALTTQGVDTGSANAYVITTLGAPTSAYADGQVVEFRSASANSGGSTINVNNLGVVNIYRFSGPALQAGDILQNAWYRLQYNSNYGGFVIIAPVASLGFTGTISSAPPTNKVGLTAASGVSTAALPSDITFAIDQSITPNWSGLHTFSAGLNATSGATVTGHGLIVGAPSGGDKGPGTINATAIYLAGVALTNGASANPTASAGLSAVNGSASTFMTSDSAPAVSQAIAPTWTAKHIFSVAGDSIVVQNDTGALRIRNTAAAAVAQISTVKGWLGSGTNVTDTAFAVNGALNVYVNGSTSAAALAIASTGGLTVATPTSGVPLTLNAPTTADNTLVVKGSTNATGAYGIKLTAQNVSSVSFGMQIQAGTNSSDAALLVQNASGGSNLLEVFGDGGVVVGAPTGSTKGVGTVNATAYYINGTSQFQSGSFTGTITGCTTAPTATFRYVIAGGMATIYCTGGLLATSNTTACTITGLPAVLTPTNGGIPVFAYGVQNNSVNVAGGLASVSGTTITFLVSTTSGGSGFTSSGNKGINADFCMTYPTG